MPSVKSIFTAASVLLAAVPTFALPACGYNYTKPEKALYFLQNNPAGGSLLALEIDNVGHAANPVRIPTGGNGASVVDATGAAVMADTLNSQGAVAVGGDYLFTVNAGSNTLAMFKVDKWNPTRPQMVGQPIDTLGDFPVSVTYSEELETVCVLNGGMRNNVACWKKEDKELCAMGNPMPLGLNLTTPPVMNSGTATEVMFSPDSKSLVVTVKGPMATMGLGPIFVFPVQDGAIAQPIVSTMAGFPMSFGFAFGSSGDSFLLSDPSFGGSLVKIAPGTEMTSEVMHTNETASLKASCWAAYSEKTSKGYLIDAGSPTFAEVDMMTGAVTDVFQTDAAFMGAFDTVFDQATAYFIAAAPSVGAYDVEQKKLVQNLNLTGMPGVDSRQWWSGIAMWTAS